MEWLIWIGAALTLGGVLGLAWCIWLAMAARRPTCPMLRCAPGFSMLWC